MNSSVGDASLRYPGVKERRGTLLVGGGQAGSIAVQTYTSPGGSKASLALAGCFFGYSGEFTRFSGNGGAGFYNRAVPEASGG
ncbi:hypothetical protein [Rubrobacter indicoceani]|uniref:hypothetical protein n=1 Tax=Rubrobacter indicoceani TaxID=2051957 RepID=UPI0013C481F0|nr:hypothetical protein [Rubrobacter indicoceani]